MHRTITLAIWITALSLLATSLFIFACNDNDDDDDDNDNDEEATPDLNGWTDEGCAATMEDKSNQLCPPPLPEGVSEESAQKILDAYLGTYTDENGNERIVSCDPEGDWFVPTYIEDTFCDYYWQVPIRVSIVEQSLTLPGFIIENDVPMTWGQLNIEYEGQLVWADREITDDSFKLIFGVTTFGAVWTKQE